MGDMGDIFNEYRAYKREKRASNTQASVALLASQGVPFKMMNGHTHLLLQAGEELIDFWPSTGLWISRETKTKQRGVFNLMKHIKKTLDKPP